MLPRALLALNWHGNPFSNSKAGRRPGLPTEVVKAVIENLHGAHPDFTQGAMHARGALWREHPLCWGDGVP